MCPFGFVSRYKPQRIGTRSRLLRRPYRKAIERNDLAPDQGVGEAAAHLRYSTTVCNYAATRPANADLADYFDMRRGRIGGRLRLV